MHEVEWVKSFAPTVEIKLRLDDKCLSVATGRKLPYADEIRTYKNTDIHNSDFMAYETDLLIIENIENEIWIPRVIVETKFRGSITTHDAITYSHKAFNHRQVHPYLRYGILTGKNHSKVIYIQDQRKKQRENKLKLTPATRL